MTLPQTAARSTIASLFANVARAYPERPALQDAGGLVRTFRAVDQRSNRIAGGLTALGIRPGDRIALLSENSLDYLEIMLACAKLGAILACQNWRLAPAELRHCLELVEPALLLHSARYTERVSEIGYDAAPVMEVGGEFTARWREMPEDSINACVDPEAPLLILYTSGTTGLPKGAVISHRAEIARNVVMHADFGLAADDTFIAWTPLYHMGGADLALGTLISGGKVIVYDGFDAERLARITTEERLGWLILMPGMVDRVIEALERIGKRPVGVKVCGVMADLIPRHQLARVTELLDAPYANTFGSTETGCPPCSSGLLPIGEVPVSLAKRQSPYCEVKLVDGDDNTVADGEPGELAMRGATLFSGYWRADDVNAHEFRGGWFHMGDVFVRNGDGTLDFVDRAKYLIKSGGENIYPAEIERVLLADPRVTEAAVVRKADPKWGEIPIAFVARSDETLSTELLYARCRAELAGYKQPKDIRFIDFDRFPRSATGKVQRHDMERWLAE
jgi:fatty-acyl-CoA synthase